jgi:hypothetical protein
MVERMIKTIKHGIIVLAATPANMDCWDQQLAKVLFGYRCGIQTSTRFSPFMILTGRTPRLRADNYLQALIAEVDDGVDMETAAAQYPESGAHCEYPQQRFTQCGANSAATKESICC